MKYIVTLLFLSFQLIAIAQSKEHAGNYGMQIGIEGEDYFETIKLTLNPNGKFLFHFYRKIEKGIPQEEIKYGKGTWTSNKRLILLKAEDSDIDATHVLNLNYTKARYDTKSPRDKSNRDIKTSIRIYESDIFWLKGRTLLKKINTSFKKPESKCCSTIEDVESYLNGKWKKKNSDEKKEYHYSFTNEQGKFNAYLVNDLGKLKEIDNGSTDIRILKSENGFRIEYNSRLDNIYDIKHLDSTKLITVRRDGKESELVRIKD